MSNLSAKQQRFVENKVAGLNGAAAAIAAGYSAAGAKVAAAKLMKQPAVAAAIRAARKRVNKPDASERQDDDSPVLKDKYPTGLALLQHAYNNPRLPVGLRIDCAKQAMPYESPKVGETGKKQSAKDRAKDIAIGDNSSVVNAANRFRTKTPPGSRR